MFKISYSPNLQGEVAISGSKNAALPIVAANYLVDNKISLENQPNIMDISTLQQIAQEAIANSVHDFYDLTSNLATKIRASILLIPFGLHKFGQVKFIGSGGCAIGKRSLDAFDDALVQAGISINEDEYKIYSIHAKPKKNIILKEFSVTATEALLIYLAFCQDIDYEINIYRIAIEPHVINLINYLRNLGTDITVHYDHSLTIKPNKIKIKKLNFPIIGDYIEAGTYFAIGAVADNSNILIKGCDVDDLSFLYNISKQIGINFKVINKHTIQVNSKNKKNYQALKKLETRLHPGFATDLQSIFGSLLTQANGISKIFETLFEGRFSYLSELQNLGAKVEILNPYQVIIIGPTPLRGAYVSCTDLRGGGAMILAGIIASGDTNITNENIILRGYENIENKLQNIGVRIIRN